MKSAALIVIGDEILTGKVKDENSFVFAKTMFVRGVTVSEIIVIPDRISVIADRVAHYSARFDYVSTSGGVGPTHDDVTFDGVAQAFSYPIHEHQEALEYFQNAQKKSGLGDQISDTQKKMLRFPIPCQLFFVEPLWLPLVRVRNVYIFPGVPHLFEKLLSSFDHLFVGEKFYREIVFTDLSENQIAFDLGRVQSDNLSVAIGSYPQLPGKPCSVMVTVEGTDERTVRDVAKELLPLIRGRHNES